MTTLQQIDLADHDAFKDRVPYEWFKTLREEDPVHWNPEEDGTGFYAVTRYHDIREVTATRSIYSSELGGTSLEDLEPDQIEARKSMIDMDPPRHDELRGLIAPPLHAARRAGVGGGRAHGHRPRARPALEQEEFDFVRDISSEIPMQVFAEILGVPQEDRRYIIELGDRLLGNQDPEYAQPTDDSHRLLPFSSPAAIEMFEFGRKMAAARRKAPGQRHRHPARVRAAHPARVRRLLRAAGDRRQRDDAAHDHARPAGAARAPRPAAAPARGPGALQARGRGDAALGDAGAPLPPHHDAGRRELAGVEMPAGAKVTTWFVSGNRDETVFEDPDTFDVGRTPNKHMAFGPGGIHHCMGAHLARLEIEIVFEELLKRVATIELAGEPERLRSNFFNGIKRLPVRVTR